MSIAFHCEHCNKKIEAQDNAGGKLGKCPACHNKVYVPAPEGDELELSPVDEQEKARQDALMAETYKLNQDILLEREGSTGPTLEISDKELTKNIILYLRQMADSELEAAEKILGSITPHSARAIQIIDRIAISEMPEPELADIPGQMLSGLIRDIRSKIY